MIRIKTLSLPLISALFATAALPVNAQVSLDLSSQKTFRQSKNGIAFRGGAFDILFYDGSVTSIIGCDFVQYYAPGFILGLCSQGTTAFLTSGSIGGATIEYPYLLVTGIAPAQVVAPREASKIQLVAAPASTLPRPSGGFTDNSASVYYNLHTAGSIREYTLTGYYSTRAYSKNQLSKFNSDIVPGVYHYSFPRLTNPLLPAVITATIYPMADGFSSRNNREEGFKFTEVNKNKWSKGGFVELSYNRPNVIQWTPLTPSNVFPAVDSLNFSIRVIADQTNPNSNTVLVDRYSGKLQSIFPAFTTEGDPRVVMANPLVGEFTTPPLFAGGTKGVIELELQRNFQTGGVTYDFSNRKFQIPIVVVNRYSEYQNLIFANSNSKSSILKDSDGDGYNNLNEWILDSSAVDANSIPVAPVAQTVAALMDTDYFTLTGNERVVRPAYFGFTIDKKLGTKPGVVYTLQRSKDRGRTWQKFVSDADWTVRTVNLAPGVGSVKANSPRRVEIRVEAKPWIEYDANGDPIALHTNEQPPGTQNDIYRVKVTLAKK